VSDTIVLTIPREQPFHPVAHLVLGGIAARLRLTVESLEDLQVALDELLYHGADDADVTVELRVADGSIEAEVGPFDADRLRTALEPGDETLGLQRVLAAVVDDVELTRDGTFVLLHKTVEAAAETV
jgi:hypothetical protein